MPVTKVGAIYATNSKLLQRIYIPHADDSEIAQQYVHPSESLIAIAIDVYRTGGAVAIQSIIGAPAHNGMCLVIHRDTGEVIDRIIADPEIYRHPEGHRIELDE
jgi:hypothetical protein